uniref:Cytochrome P450 3075A3 n=1 Tax=Paracyclopina nana TaxID=565004 RepID=A0A0F7J1Q5_PARNA|nr:cytochrome P450 3075A3 [Paracyclopina nana]
MWLILLAIFLCAFTYFWISKTSKPAKLPPGPPRYPIVGSAFSMKPPNSSRPELFWAIRDLKEKYGSIFSLYLGNTTAVVFTELEDIKDIFGREETANRPPIPGFRVRPGWDTPCKIDPELNAMSPPGVIFSNGHYWKDHRRFLLKNLRDFGFGKTSMEEAIGEEVQKLMVKLKASEGKPIGLNRTFNISILNALWNILAGEKLELDDPKLLSLLKCLDDLVKTIEGPAGLLSSMLPFESMAYWPIIKQIIHMDTLQAVIEGLMSLIRPNIAFHQDNLDENVANDFIDVMLNEIARTTDPNSSFYGECGKFALINILIDLFIAGTETTSSSLLWSVLFLLHHPECQFKIQREIDEVIGQIRLPMLDDKSSLHYTSAFLQESLRFASFVPMSVFHYSSKDIEYKGYSIPKGSMLLSSLYHVMYNPEFFPEPEVFKPERFIDANGHFMPDDRVVAFGLGKRVCLGKTLAEKEFFLFFAALLQNYEFKSAPGEKLPPIDIESLPVVGLIRAIPDYKVVYKKRY